MPREVEPTLNERQFFTAALAENLRLDGRAFDQFRPLELTFGDEYGVCDVRLGKTRIHTQISATISTPLPDRPFDGLFTITTSLSPMTSPHYSNEPSRPSPLELHISRLLEKTIRRSNALDTESLCLLAGQKCWSLRADVHVLSSDGGLVDAACIGVIAALLHFRRPESEVRGEEVVVFSEGERQGVGLSMLHQPYCVTFSFYGGEVVLVDAAGTEEGVRGGEVTVGVNRFGEVCQVAKLGGVPVDAVVLLECVRVAVEKVKVISKFVQGRLEEDAKRRDKGGLIAELLSAENERTS